MRIFTTTHLTAGAWVACEGTVENLNAPQEIVRGMKYGRLTTLNIPKYTTTVELSFSFEPYVVFGLLCFFLFGVKTLRFD